MDCGISSAPTHPWLKVSRWENPKVKTRTTYELVGSGTKHNYRAYNSTVNAMERAFKERMYFYKDEAGEWCHVPRPEAGLIKEESSEFIECFRKLATYTKPIDLRDFPSHFKAAKYYRYTNAVDRLMRSTNWNYSKFARVKHFIKYETYNLTLKPNPKPRGINPRSDEFLVLLGRRIKPLEKKIYKVLEDIFGYKIIFKGMNQATRAQKFREYYDVFDDPVSIEEDASAFEASVSSDWLSFTHEIYLLFYKQDRELAILLNQVLLSEGSARAGDGKINFKFEGMGSGDPDTSLGNCLISAFQFWLFMKYVGVRKHRCGIDGDDKTPIMERSDALRAGLKIKEFYLKRGFRITCGSIQSSFEKLVFCGSQPVKVDEGYVMVRKPKECISKDVVSRKPLRDDRTFRRWIKSVGECGMAQNGGIPILQEFYACLDRNAGSAKPFEKDSFMNEAYSFKVQGMNRKYKTVTEETRASFYEAFGISPMEQEEIEAFYMQLTLQFNPQQPEVFEQRLPW